MNPVQRPVSKFIIIVALCMGINSLAKARPFLTQPVATVGPGTFEAGFLPSFRQDAFNSPKTHYVTTVLPVSLTIGVHSRMDMGFKLTSIHHILKKGENRLKGSGTGLFSPHLKISPMDSMGFILIWHTPAHEKSQEGLPFARGNDIEGLALFRLPTTWPFHLNVGYVFREFYRSKFGINNGILYKVEPGNIFESRASLEVPWRHNLSLVSELAYTAFQKKKIGGQSIADSSGEALDALVGLGWAWEGWNINVGTGFGLLDEKHSSFEAERGEGNISYKLLLSYRVSPKKYQ